MLASLRESIDDLPLAVEDLVSSNEIPDLCTCRLRDYVVNLKPSNRPRGIWDLVTAFARLIDRSIEQSPSRGTRRASVF